MLWREAEIKEFICFLFATLLVNLLILSSGLRV